MIISSRLVQCRKASQQLRVIKESPYQGKQSMFTFLVSTDRSDDKCLFSSFLIVT